MPTTGLGKTTGLFPAEIYVHRSQPQRAKFVLPLPVSAPSYIILFPIIIRDTPTLEDDSSEVMHEISDKPEQTSRVL